MVSEIIARSRQIKHTQSHKTLSKESLNAALRKHTACTTNDVKAVKCAPRRAWVFLRLVYNSQLLEHGRCNAGWAMSLSTSRGFEDIGMVGAAAACASVKICSAC